MLVRKLASDDNTVINRGEKKLEGNNTIPQEILVSRDRCKALGLSCLTEPKKYNGKYELNDSLITQQDVLDHVEDCLKKLQGYEISIGVFQRNRCLFKLFNFHYKGLPFDEGTDWAEHMMGTNAVDLALKHKRCFRVEGEEHYAEIMHSILCYAEPVWFEGEVIGAIAIFMPVGCDNIIVRGFLSALTKSVEGIIEVGKFKKELGTKIGWEKAIVNTISEGFFSIDRDGVITYMNSLGAHILGLNKDEVVGRKLADVVGFRPELLDILDTGEGWIDRELCFKSIKKGTVRLIKNAAPIKNDNGEVIGVLDTFREIKRVHNLVNKITGANSSFMFEDIIYKSPEMQNAINMARVAAASQGPVIIQGESGTGKELFAHAIHSDSNRSQGPFIVVDCAALPRELIESELFGYVEGAFTGAVRKGRAGKFELAHGGTIFLDELGELPLDSQAKLLRVLQTHTITRIGDNKTLPVDFRVIAATNKDLEKEVAQYNFRKDLFYRLNVFNIYIPPLRKRKEDISILANHFIKKANINDRDIRISEEAFLYMFSYDWPGNVRELENVIQRAIFLAKGNIIQKEHLPEKVVNNKNIISQSTDVSIDQNTIFYDIESEKRYITSVLRSCKGNKSKAADVLGISRPTLYKKIKELQIS